MKPTPEETWQQLQQTVKEIRSEIARVIVGQEQVVEQMMAALLCRGHCLLVGVPGLAKTLLVSTLGQVLGLNFRRIQFTPDLMPADIVGSEILQGSAEGKRSFEFVPGPVFINLLLADEINRTPPKTQAALLEAMQEKQVTVAGTSRSLSEPFIVYATQNPVEHEGTYPLPEAQLDRFLVKTSMGYPTHEESIEILSRKLQGLADTEETTIICTDCIREARKELSQVYVHSDLLGYAASICENTRRSKDVVLGASPRAMIALVRVAQGYAAISGRDHVLPDDIKRAAIPVLAHRIVFQNSFYHRGDLGTALIERILEIVPVPSEQINFSRR